MKRSGPLRHGRGRRAGRALYLLPGTELAQKGGSVQPPEGLVSRVSCENHETLVPTLVGN